MSLPKLYAHLQSLPSKMLDRFTLYLQSPLHTVHRETLTLWLALRNHVPAFSMSDELLFAQAFPSKPYNNARLRVLRSYLMDHLEHFLAYSAWEQDRALRHRMLRRAEHTYQLPSASKQAWEAVAHAPYWDLDLALEEFWLRQDHLQVRVRTQNRGASHPLAEVLSPLDSFYVITRLKYFCALADPMTRPAALPQDGTITHLLGLYEALGLQTQPLAELYYHMLQLFLGQAPEPHLAALKRLLHRHRPQIDPHECLNLYTYWFNFLNHRHRSGQPEAIHEIFELYQEMIAVDVLFEEGSFAANHCRNIVMVAAMLGEYAWGHDFLDRYHGRLQDPWRGDVFAYGKAYLHFATRHYREAKRALVGVEFHDPEYKINHQMLYLRIYFETDDFDGMIAVRDALRVYLHRNTAIPATARHSANNFARFAVRLFHLRQQPGATAALQRLQAEMAACTELRDRNWLFAKAEALAGNGAA